jgi:hypothetical protein
MRKGFYGGRGGGGGFNNEPETEMNFNQLEEICRDFELKKGFFREF